MTQQWTQVKHLMRYVSATRNLNLNYERKGERVQYYVDADWANDKETKRSFTGYIPIMSGDAISWKCRKQKMVSLSTTSRMCSIMRNNEGRNRDD